jgi:hypothetical protein
MCIACELGFWIAINEPPPSAVLSSEVQTARFACDAAESEIPKPAAQSTPDERQP